MKIDRRDFVKLGALGSGAAAIGATTSACASSSDGYAIPGSGPFLSVSFAGLIGFIFRTGGKSTVESAAPTDVVPTMTVVLMNPKLVPASNHEPYLVVESGTASSKELSLADCMLTFDINPRPLRRPGVVLMSPGCAPSNDGGWRPINWIARIDSAVPGTKRVNPDLTDKGTATDPDGKPVTPIATCVMDLSAGFFEGSRPRTDASRLAIWSMKRNLADDKPVYEQAMTDFSRWVVPLDPAKPSIQIRRTTFKGQVLPPLTVEPSLDQPIRIAVINDQKGGGKHSMAITEPITQFAAFYALLQRETSPGSWEEIPYAERRIPIFNRSIDDPYGTTQARIADNGDAAHAKSGPIIFNVGEPMCNGGGTQDPPI